MAIDLAHTTKVLKTALLRDLGDEVDLIFRYGSFLKGTAHAYSDLDISYVPANEATKHSITVMVNDTLCDLYPIRWSQLERMASFENVSSTVLLNNEIVYQRSEAVAERFHMLAAQLRTLLQPEARPAMIKKAQDCFQQTGYPFYLLQQQAANGHLLSCMQHAQQILRTVLHCLAVFNQACIDTRKLEQVLALPKLPVGFAQIVDDITRASESRQLLAASEALLNTTRDLLLAEQRLVQHSETTFATVFHAAYPELKGALQHMILACERQNMFSLRDPLISLYHELALGMAHVFTGVHYSAFNSLAEYEQDLIALGFPALLPYVEDGDFAGLLEQCLAFDRRLQTFFTQHAVALNTFATVEALQAFLGVEAHADSMNG